MQRNTVVSDNFCLASELFSPEILLSGKFVKGRKVHIAMGIVMGPKNINGLCE
jgi:hypothetical protein